MKFSMVENVTWALRGETEDKSFGYIESLKLSFTET